MSGTRDPYYEWLGIPPKDQPANHYRLLGLEIFEENRDVIAAAADRQMSFVKSYQCGADSELSQRILNELSATRLCLLNPKKKAAYDDQLKSELQPLVAEENIRATATDGPAPRIRHEQEPPSRTPAHRALLATPLPSRIMVIAICTGLVCLLAGVAVSFLLIRTLVNRSPSDESVAQNREEKPAENDIGPEAAIPDIGRVTDGKGEGNEPLLEETPAVGERPLQPTTGPVVESEPPAPQTTDPEHLAGTSAPTEDVESTESMLEPPAAAPIPSEKEITEPDETASLPMEPEPTTNLVDLPKRRQVPDLDSRQRTKNEITELYGLAADTLPSKKKQLCKEFMELARDPKETEGRRFVFLDLSAQLARDTGDAVAMLEAVEEIGQNYDVRTADVKANMLVQLLGTAEDQTRVMTFLKTSQDVVCDAVKADDFDAANRLSTVAVGLCDRQVGGKEFRQGIRDLCTEVERLRVEYELVEKAQSELERDDANPDARWTVGRWFCFIKNDWDRGLGYLASANDASIREIAHRELQGVSVDAAERIALANSWWNVAQNVDEDIRHGVLLRARHWYTQIDRNSLSGFEQDKTDQRVARIDELVGELRPGCLALLDGPNATPISDPSPGATPEEVPTLFARGLAAALKDRDYQLAERLFGRCVDLDPNLVPALNNRALASLRGGNARQAIHLWETACNLAPKTDAIAHNLSLLSRLAGRGHINLHSATRKSLDALATQAGTQTGTRSSSFGFRYMPIDGSQGASGQYNDTACIHCTGLGHVPCPARGCSRGTVGSTRNEVAGRNPVTGQAIVKIVPIRVPCGNCRGQGHVDCPHCSNGTMGRTP
ncbi:MAG: hypothetical protein H8E44_11280 [Planctomycetes bacterium]|nr:hypothetical protein [Planctomycetota bacterium]MBL7039848.1 hypothetical protein [Pirellulaceae bacterium]